ncbi:MAG: leucine--tRNA ligase [archaeon]
MVEMDFKKIEKKWQDAWEKKKAFESEPKKEKKFFLTTPYPYISGSLHLGHGRAATESDIYSRFMRMNGFNVLYPMAFHITGTPVLGISAAIKNGDKNMVKLYESYVSAYVKDTKKVKDIVKSFIEPEKIVEFFIPKMIEEYKQLGLSVDWRRSFTSGDMEHQQMVTWQFENYKEKGYLIKEKYPVLYSPEDESAMGEDDIKEADSNPVEKMEFTLLKFEFKDKYLVAATLRPETVFGQTNLWANPEIEYQEAKVGNETWIMSKEAVEKLKFQRSDVTLLGKTKEKLLGEYAIAPMINKKLMILPSRFVDADVGSGIVTSVPSDAPYDYIALKDLQNSKELEKKYGFNLKKIAEIEEIEVIPIINTDKYGDKAGVKVVEEAKVFNQDDPRLDQLTQEVYKEGFHKGILNENCGNYKGMSVREAKDKMKMDMIKRKEAEIMFETSRKALSRSGGKIIVAMLDNQWFIDFNAKGWKDKANQCLKNIELVPESARKQFEDTFAWLDKRPCARRRGLGTAFPFDKGWIIESLSDSTIYMTLYTINHIIRENNLKRNNLTHEFFDYVYLGKGEINDVARNTKVKESVLKQCRESYEYWMPMDHRHTFVLHLSNHLSFMIFAFAGIFPEKYWPKKITLHGLIVSEGTKMSKSKGNVITLLNVNKNYGADVFRFYLTQSTSVESIFDWRENEAGNARQSIERVYNQMIEAANKRKKGKINPLYESKFNRIVKEATEKIGQMKLREYNSLVVFDMIRMVKEAKLAMNEGELAAFYDMITDKWVRLISPVCPHIAEEVWSNLGNKGFVSLESWPEAETGKINDKLEEADRNVEKTIGDITNVLKIIKEKQGKDGEKVYLYVMPFELQNYNAEALAKRIGKEIKVFAVNDKNKYDPEGKSGKAKPGKPGIFIE